VDAVAEHYYKAELLLFSLVECAGHKKEQIVVHCTSRVDEGFLIFLQENGYRSVVVQPYLDGKYCNKIPQLDVFVSLPCRGVILLDVDMFVLRPINIDDESSLWAKVVDGSNPPLHVLENIFNSASVKIPEIVDTDWPLGDGKTIATNCNGGFYFVPARYVAELSRNWRRWAEWLYYRPELFENEKQRNHIDQVSMAICMAENGILHKDLPANFNCPTHRDMMPRSLDATKDISVLHYHSLITRFGLLDKTNISIPSVSKAIDIANRAIAKHQRFNYFSAYKRSQIKAPVDSRYPHGCAQVLNGLLKYAGKNRKTLIFHAGTPKTGTTSLQFFMDRERESLRRQGVLYPEVHDVSFAPKHQWIVRNLLTGDIDGFGNNLLDALQDVDDSIHTIFLSTEGIFNHWWDFPEESKALLASLTGMFDVQVWVWFRGTLSFAESFYRQNIKNPQLKMVECYGRDMTVGQMLDDTWFTNHLDYTGFLYECEALFGKNGVVAFAYGNDIIPTACEKLGVTVNGETVFPRENIGHTAPAIEILRVINRYPLNVDEKKDVLSYVDKLNGVLARYSEERVADADVKERVESLSSLVLSDLKYEYGIDLSV
jgi:hypothetical protein